MNILAISGSLRLASVNAALLRTVKQQAPIGIAVDLYEGLGALPLFNPDMDETLPAPVAAFRARVASADALLIASPEYAHGVTGAIKNALDWLVSHEPFVNKLVAVINTSITVPLLGSKLDTGHLHESLLVLGGIDHMHRQLALCSSVQVGL